MNSTPEATFTAPSPRQRLCMLIGDWHPATFPCRPQQNDETLAILLGHVLEKGDQPEYITNLMIELAATLELPVPR